MNKGLTLFFTLLFSVSVFAQTDLQQMLETERAFELAAEENGTKSAFLEFLADDAVIFRPAAVNGREFWKLAEESSPATLSRKSTYADIAANGLLGYTTGNWRLYPKGKSESLAKFGQYVTIWEKKPDGKFRASLDIMTVHEKLPFSETDPRQPPNKSSDLNKKNWSPADDSMNFLKMSMTKKNLGGAYEKFAASDVRLLRSDVPPITGRKNVVSEMKRYISVAFPKKIALFQSADMAYVWNPCEFADSNEGTEKGNCLHIWKLRDKKWWIVLGILAPIPNETQPTLKTRQKNTGKN